MPAPRTAHQEPQPDDGAIWLDLCLQAELVVNVGKYVERGNHAYAVFRLRDGTIRVLDDSCPHAGGSLSAGRIEEGPSPCVICPVHGWPFEIASGSCADNGLYVVKSYPVRIVADKVQVRVWG